MSEIVRASRGELTLPEVLEVLESGGRVVISETFLGKRMEMVLRKHDGTYYCDTAMKLFTHETVEAFGGCLRKFRLVKPEDESGLESSPARREGTLVSGESSNA